MNNSRLSVKIPQKMMDKLDKKAKGEGYKSRSELIREIFEKYMKGEKMPPSHNFDRLKKIPVFLDEEKFYEVMKEKAFLTLEKGRDIEVSEVVWKAFKSLRGKKTTVDKEVIEKMDKCQVCGEQINKEMLVEHHTSYNPEKTIKICRFCHSKIHNTDKYPNLKPEPPKRRESYSEKEKETEKESQIKRKVTIPKLEKA